MSHANLEKNKRFDFAFGIVVAAIIGFILNLLANIYYDLFIVHSITMDNVDKNQLVGLILALVGMFGFLQFFIDDYRNELKLNKSFLARFNDYFFYQYTPGKWIRVITGIYVGLVLLVVLGMLYYFMATFTGYLIATIVFSASFYKVYREERMK